MKVIVTIVVSAFLASMAVCAQKPTEPNSLAPDDFPKFGTIAGYQPTTQVVDHMSIDLDKKAVDELLALHTEDSFARARRIYREGAHRRSYALLNLTQPLGFALKKDAHFFFGKTTDGKVVTGNAYDDYVVNATQIGIRYTTIDDQAAYQTCTVGALTPDQMNLAGCFASTGFVKMMSNDPKLVYKYTYDPLTANKSPRSLRYFSTNFELHTDSVYARDYYGRPYYADEWVEAAFTKTSTNYTRGGADFSAMGFDGREQAIKTGIVVLHSFMYAINECSNHTQKYCGGGSGLPGQPGFTNYAYWKTLHAWDECPAFFTGSMDAVNPGTGNLVYNMANEQCPEWKTCGPDGNSIEGTAKVLLDTWTLLAVGRDKILAGNCVDTVSTKNKIAQKWYIPLIQGTMSCSYQLFISRSEKLVAKCATFAAAILPRVHAASPTDAATIYDNTKVSAMSTDYQAVWTAFANVYPALGISQADIGEYQLYTSRPTSRPIAAKSSKNAKNFTRKLV